MNRRRSLPLVLLALLASANAESASTTVPPVHAVTDAMADRSISVACANPRIRSSEVRTVLGPHDALRTNYLRKGLVRAVEEACEQKVASIVVTRRGMRVDWAPALDATASAAIAVR